MTDKQKVKDFLDFLNTHQGSIVTNDSTYTYSEMRSAICNCISGAFEDGYQRGKEDAEADSLYDTSISGHEDW